MNQKRDQIKIQKSQKGSHIESLLHTQHQVTVEKMAVGGDGVARIEFNEQKIVVFIPYSVSRDVLKIQIIKTEKNFLTAKIVEIINPSPFRVTPSCEYFGTCGGCQWQHIKPERQVSEKEIILKDLFQKFLPHISYELLPSQNLGPQWEYRNRIQLKHTGLKLGFFKPESHDIVDIQDCLIAEAPLRQELKNQRSKLKNTDALKKYELKINQNNKVEFYKIGAQSEGLSFAQVNTFMNQELIKAVVQIFENIKPRKITEFYAGSGNFTWPLFEKIQPHSLEAIELNTQLTQNAALKIRELNCQKSVKFFTTKAETFSRLHGMSSEAVLLDPPRGGCEKSLVIDLAEAAPKNIVYISCHPVSLVRDLQFFFKLNPRYQIKHLQIFNLFPQTDHFETLCWLERNP